MYHHKADETITCTCHQGDTVNAGRQQDNAVSLIMQAVTDQTCYNNAHNQMHGDRGVTVWIVLYQ